MVAYAYSQPGLHHEFQISLEQSVTRSQKPLKSHIYNCTCVIVTETT